MSITATFLTILFRDCLNAPRLRVSLRLRTCDATERSRCRRILVLSTSKRFRPLNWRTSTLTSWDASLPAPRNRPSRTLSLTQHQTVTQQDDGWSGCRLMARFCAASQLQVDDSNFSRIRLRTGGGLNMPYQRM